MSAIATFKTKYENHTIIYNVEPCFLGYKLELSIDDRFWDSAKSTDRSDPPALKDLLSPSADRSGP